MTLSLREAGDLKQLEEMSALVQAWLAGDPVLTGAQAELEHCLAGPRQKTPEGAPQIAPAWANEAWVRDWSARLLADQPDAATRDVVKKQIAALCSGAAEVVVTGQQPGLLGGPLYTLLKVATTVALARRRSAAGRPTVPLFWSGDDDDDLDEALAPVIYDPARATLLLGDRSANSGGKEPADQRPRSDVMIGSLLAEEVEAGAALWLNEQAPHHPLAADLARLWHESLAAGLNWGRLQRRALARVFAGSGLLMVSGNDAGLHAVAAPLYRRIWSERGRWSTAVREGGEELRRGAFHVQIRATAAEQFLRRSEGDRRVAVTMAADAVMPSAEHLRPGVAFRAAVQDWLLRPAAVVVGPAEVAYLKQLETAYVAFDIPRPPLVPRLFGQLVPANFSAPDLNELNADTIDDEVIAAAQGVVERSGDALGEALVTVGGVDPERARRLAAAQSARWLRGISSLLMQEQQRLREQSRPRWPAWVAPAGLRQERVLATHCATALWGTDLVDAVLVAAERHLAAGSEGRWQHYQIVVPEPGGIAK